MKKIIIVSIYMLSITLYCKTLEINPVLGEIESGVKKLKEEIEYVDEERGEQYCFDIGKNEILASSSLKNIANNNYHVQNICDFNLKTVWVEGVKGYGIGEWVEMKLGKRGIPIRKILIYNGYTKNINTWMENSRVKKMKLYVDDKLYAVLNLKDSRESQTFYIDEQFMQNRSIKFEIEDVYKGEKYDDAAITEIIIAYYSLCFPSFTNISLSDNSVKTIDQVKSGDEILTYNSADNKFEKTKVVSVAKVPHNNLVEIDFGDRVITSTDDHPYLSENGWKSCNVNGTKQYKGYENVKELKTGDKIYFIGENGKSELKEINGIKKVDKKEMCYTITKVENGDNFIADGAVVGVEEIKEE